MSSNPDDIGYFYSGGASNDNPFLSTGGAKSSFKIKKSEFNNLWTDISERQARYGYKDHRCFYVQNLHTTLTIKNARAYFNESDKFSTLQIGSAPVNTTEQVAPGNPQPTSQEIVPSQWATAAADPIIWTIIQDFNSTEPAPAGMAYRLGQDTPLGLIRVAIKIDDASASFVNQAPGRVSFVMRREGSPEGDAVCKIWNSDGDTEATIGTLDVGTLPEGAGSSIPISFTNESQSYKVQVGDLIGSDSRL